MPEIEPKNHPIILTTRTRYVIPSSKYMIPGTWARYHLSQLINKVLSSPQPIPFDFLVKGELLTGSLSEWCSERGIGEEETVEIEYIESVLPPELLASEQTDDWVGSISARYKNFFLTASYDGCVRLHDSSRRTVATLTSHSAPVTSACWVAPHPTDSFDGEQTIASSSFDHTVHLTRLSATTLEPTTLATLHMHTAPVSSVTVDSSGQWLISAGWDGLVGVWSRNIPEVDEVQDIQEVVQKKRRKLADSSTVKKAPGVVLKSHKGRVSKAIFGPTQHSQLAYSCGWDSTVRSWDVESGVCVNTVTLADRAHLDIIASGSGDVLYAASADRTVSLLDLRVASAQSSSRTLVHPATASCLAVHPTSPFHLLTGAYDGFLRVWDVRSPRTALAKFEHTVQSNSGVLKRGKILGVDWAHGLAVCAGEVGFGMWHAGVGGRE